MTPYELGILLDVYVGTPIKASPLAPIYNETMDGLCSRGLIIMGENDCEYLLTAKLNVLMHHIMSTPDPVWKMP